MGKQNTIKNKDFQAFLLNIFIIENKKGEYFPLRCEI